MSELPMYELPGAHEALAALVQEWRLLRVHSDVHPWLKQDSYAWDQTIRDLIEEVERDEKAIFELIKKDPRYLGSPLILTKVFHWKLCIIAAQERLPADPKECPESFKEQQQRRATESTKNLRLLAKAILFVTGRGNQSRWQPRRMRHEYERTLQAVDRAKQLLSEGHDIASVAKRARLSAESAIELKEHPRSRKGIAVAELARRYSTDPERMRKVIEKAIKSSEHAEREIEPD